MSWPTSVGWIVFILVPGSLWALGASANRGRGFVPRVLGFMVGTDNRLSLSRLQAFLWTLVIFGSFAASMAIHTHIKSGTQAEVEAATKKAKDAAEEATNAKAAYQAARAEEVKAKGASKAAGDASVIAEAAAAALGDEAQKNNKLAQAAQAAQEKASEARADEKTKAALLPGKQEAVRDAAESWKVADAAAKIAEQDAQSYAWVQIPVALLALAGIAIGSGVFSSLIAAVGGEEQTASISGIAENTDKAKPNSLLITGSNLGATTGEVRFHGKVTKALARVVSWEDDKIVVETPADASYSKMTVETAKGKLTYKVDYKGRELGFKITHYELADLFRDDKDPDTLSLMKFQMFGWTAIAICIYVYLFLTNLTNQIQTLPVVDPSIAILTGVSQAGYLAGKGVSNVTSR